MRFLSGNKSLNARKGYSEQKRPGMVNVSRLVTTASTEEWMVGGNRAECCSHRPENVKENYKLFHDIGRIEVARMHTAGPDCSRYTGLEASFCSESRMCGFLRAGSNEKRKGESSGKSVGRGRPRVGKAEMIHRLVREQHEVTSRSFNRGKKGPETNSKEVKKSTKNKRLMFLPHSALETSNKRPHTTQNGSISRRSRDLIKLMKRGTGVASRSKHRLQDKINAIINAEEASRTRPHSKTKNVPNYSTKNNKKRKGSPKPAGVTNRSILRQRDTNCWLVPARNHPNFNFLTQHAEGLKSNKMAANRYAAGKRGRKGKPRFIKMNKKKKRRGRNNSSLIPKKHQNQSQLSFERNHSTKSRAEIAHSRYHSFLKSRKKSISKRTNQEGSKEAAGKRGYLASRKDAKKLKINDFEDALQEVRSREKKYLSTDRNRLFSKQCRAVSICARRRTDSIHKNGRLNASNHSYKYRSPDPDTSIFYNDYGVGRHKDGHGKQ